jgi:protein-tyrosine phosphatase
LGFHRAGSEATRLLGVSVSPVFKNFRDLGGIPVAGGVIAPGRLFRTAHLSYLDESLAERLANVHGVRTYLDFRTDDEIGRAGAPEPLIARGVRWERRPFDIADPIFWGVSLPAAGDWSGLYARALERLRPTFVDVVNALVTVSTPVVFGCWAGKDRTGMVAALLLSVLGVNDEAIAADYALTTPGLAAHEDDFSFLWRDAPERRAELFRSFCEAPPVVMHTFLEGVRARYGSARAVLDLSEPTVQALRRSFIESVPVNR